MGLPGLTKLGVDILWLCPRQLDVPYAVHVLQLRNIPLFGQLERLLHGDDLE